MDRSTIAGLVIIALLLAGYTWYGTTQATKREEQRQELIQEQIRQDSIAIALEREAQLAGEGEETVAEEDGLAANGVAESATEQTVAAETAVAETEKKQESIAAPAQSEGAEIESQEPDSIPKHNIAYISPTLYEARQGEEQFYRVENDVMVVTLSNKGGMVHNVELKEYKRYNGEPLMMAKDGSVEFDFNFGVSHNHYSAYVNTSEYYFETDAQPTTTVSGDSETISMRLYADANSYVEYLYIIKKDEYMVDYKVRFHNMDNYRSPREADASFTWGAIGLQQEKGYDNEKNYTSVAYKFPDKKKPEDLGSRSANESKSVQARVEWVAFKQQYFSSIFIAEQNFLTADMSYVTYQPDGEHLRNFGAELRIPYDVNTNEYGFSFYYGPNQYNELEQYGDLNLHRIVPLGPSVVSWINRYAVIPIFNFLSNKIASFGIIILILTVLLRIVVFPFVYKTYMSGAKMRVIKPEVDALNEKYPDKEDAMKKQQEMMALYKKAGVNPMGGCLPLLIQMPIFIAMFRFLPASIELRGQSFLWAEDLSSYDSILDLPFSIPFYGDHISLFTLLMAVMMMISGRISMSQQTGTDAPGMGGMRIMMLYFMPIMMLAIFNNYASGLTYYYSLSTTIAVLQMLAFRLFTDEDKLRAKMEENAAKQKNKPKKKSKWQQRYDAMMKQQQEAQKQQRRRK